MCAREVYYFKVFFGTILKVFIEFVTILLLLYVLFLIFFLALGHVGS